MEARRTHNLLTCRPFEHATATCSPRRRGLDAQHPRLWYAAASAYWSKYLPMNMTHAVLLPAALGRGFSSPACAATLTGDSVSIAFIGAAAQTFKVSGA